MKAELSYAARVCVALTCVLAACAEPPEEVQQPVRVAEPSPIEYPFELWEQGVQGETEIMIHVTDMGAVDSVVVSKSSGMVAFDSAAVSGARKLRFSPGRRGDRRVAMWTRMPVRFSQDSSTTVGAPIGSGNDW